MSCQLGDATTMCTFVPFEDLKDRQCMCGTFVLLGNKNPQMAAIYWSLFAKGHTYLISAFKNSSRCVTSAK